MLKKITIKKLIYINSIIPILFVTIYFILPEFYIYTDSCTTHYQDGISFSRVYETLWLALLSIIITLIFVKLTFLLSKIKRPKDLYWLLPLLIILIALLSNIFVFFSSQIESISPYLFLISFFISYAINKNILSLNNQVDEKSIIKGNIVKLTVFTIGLVISQIFFFLAYAMGCAS
jgi:hypothetical protein